MNDDDETLCGAAKYSKLWFRGNWSDNYRFPICLSPSLSGSFQTAVRWSHGRLMFHFIVSSTRVHDECNHVSIQMGSQRIRVLSAAAQQYMSLNDTATTQLSFVTISNVWEREHNTFTFIFLLSSLPLHTVMYTLYTTGTSNVQFHESNERIKLPASSLFHSNGERCCINRSFTSCGPQSEMEIFLPFRHCKCNWPYNGECIYDAPCNHIIVFSDVGIATWKNCRFSIWSCSRVCVCVALKRLAASNQ